MYVSLPTIVPCIWLYNSALLLFVLRLPLPGWSNSRLSRLAAFVLFFDYSRKWGAAVGAQRWRPVLEHDLGGLLHPGLMSAALGPVQVPIGY